mmetsp:Transcript_31085/g.91315  ORF Transcript_31085/g.91315 Transcript_31085/m.91315 type:complete len:83 (+) Transcript_31085:773-1021(+)
MEREGGVLCGFVTTCAKLIVRFAPPTQCKLKWRELWPPRRVDGRPREAAPRASDACPHMIKTAKTPPERRQVCGWTGEVYNY